MTAFGYFLTRPNVRWFEKGNAKFWANLQSKSDRNYHILEIGNPEKPYNGIPSLYIQIPKKKLILLNTEGDKIKSLGGRVKKAQGEFPVDWPDGAEKIYLGSYTFIVYKNKLLSFSARHLGTEYWENIAPRIGKKEQGPFYKFPLNENEVRYLLGKPDKITDFFRM